MKLGKFWEILKDKYANFLKNYKAIAVKFWINFLTMKRISVKVLNKFYKNYAKILAQILKKF